MDYLNNYQNYDLSYIMIALGISQKDKNILMKLAEDNENERNLFLAVNSLSENEIVYLSSVIDISKEMSKIFITRLNCMQLLPIHIGILLNAKSIFIRTFAVSVATLEQLLTVALNEENSLVTNEIVDSFSKFEITSDIANTLLSAKSYILRIYSLNYAGRKNIIHSSIKEENILVAINLIKYFKANNISTEEADILMYASCYEIREFVSEYSSIEVLINRAIIETNDDVINHIINRLLKYNIQGDRLLTASSPKIREFAITISTNESLLKRISIENDIRALDKIMTKLTTNGLSQKEADELIDIPIDDWRAYLVLLVSDEFLVKRALVEESEVVLKKIISRLKENQISESDLNTLLEKAISNRIRLYAAKYASKSSLLFAACNTQSASVYNQISKRLYSISLTSEDSDILLNSKASEIRNIATKNATKKAILRSLKTEDNINVIFNMIMNLKQYTICTNDEIYTDEDDKLYPHNADEILKYSNCTPVVAFFIKFASKNAIIAFSMKNTDDKLDNFIIDALKKYTLTDDDAAKLLFANSLNIAKIGIDLLGKEKISKFIKSTYC